MTRILNINIIENGRIFPGAIDFEDSKIVAVHENTPTTPADEIIDGRGQYACPGFVDIHVHGGGNIDFMGASPDQVKEAVAAHARRGTTTIRPTTVTASLELTRQRIQNVRAAAQSCDATVPGIHLEGPFLSPAQAGAQDPKNLLHPSREIFTQLESLWPDGIKIMGVAPELPGGVEFGNFLKSKGILATIAHSDADYPTCCEALKNGYSDITHIYSGCSMVHRIKGFRVGGVVEAGLVEDGFTVQIIADGCHLPAELLKLIFKCKGKDKISLITDALFPAGANLPEGSVLTQANGMQTILEDGVMKMPDRQAFAGSIATMDRLVRNMVSLGVCSLPDAVTMATATPARVAGLKDKGHLSPGFDADIVLLDSNLYPTEVYAKGKKIQ